MSTEETKQPQDTTTPKGEPAVHAATDASLKTSTSTRPKQGRDPDNKTPSPRKRGRKPKLDADGNPLRAKKKRKKKEMPTTDSAVDCVGIFWSLTPIPQRGKDILRDIGPYFTPQKIDEVLVRFIRDGKDNDRDEDESPVRESPTTESPTKGLRLRVLDWLATNWSKKHNEVVYSEDDSTPAINVNDDYNSMLKFYGRRFFDVFRRRERLYFVHNGETFETTVAQLNFMHWLDKTHLLKYAAKNWKAIAKDMSETISANQARKRAAREAAKVVVSGNASESGNGTKSGNATKPKTQKATLEKASIDHVLKRQSLSKPPARACHVFRAPCVVKFGANA